MKKKEKWTPHIIAAAAFVVFIVLGLACASTPSKKTTDDGLEYYRESEKIYISGYKGTSKDLVIPETINGYPVTNITYGAFRSKNLTSVIIPSSIINIGANAFRNNNLTGIIIPSSVTTVDDGAFMDNDYLDVADVEIPKHLFSRMEAIFGEEFYYNYIFAIEPELADLVNEAYERANKMRDEGDYAAAIHYYQVLLLMYPRHTDGQRNLKQVWDRRIKENQHLYPAPFEGEWKHVFSPATTRIVEERYDDLAEDLAFGKKDRTRTKIVSIPESNITIVFTGNNYKVKNTSGDSFSGTFFYSNEKFDYGKGEKFTIDGYPIIIELEDGFICGFDGAKINLAGIDDDNNMEYTILERVK